MAARATPSQRKPPGRASWEDGRAGGGGGRWQQRRRGRWRRGRWRRRWRRGRQGPPRRRRGRRRRGRRRRAVAARAGCKGGGGEGGGACGEDGGGGSGGGSGGGGLCGGRDGDGVGDGGGGLATPTVAHEARSAQCVRLACKGAACAPRVRAHPFVDVDELDVDEVVGHQARRMSEGVASQRWPARTPMDSHGTGVPAAKFQAERRGRGSDRVSVHRCRAAASRALPRVVAAQLQVRDDRGDARLRRGGDRGVRRCRRSSPALTLEPRVPPQRLRRGAQASAHEIWLIGANVRWAGREATW